MIVAPAGNILDGDKKTIQTFFEKINDFKKVEWFSKE